mmetsp:Transcript_40485/g.61746  ORF Transcript_40485/g.61746 Transcript_40485/m.61746 type:complete len:211 (+) Transcript_40485:3376-4008(+)
MEDRCYAMGLFKYTYGYWELIRNDLRNNPYFQFNWIAQMRSVVDIQRRCDYLISQFKKELYGKDEDYTLDHIKSKNQPKKEPEEKKTSSKILFQSTNVRNGSSSNVLPVQPESADHANEFSKPAPKKRGRKPKVRPEDESGEKAESTEKASPTEVDPGSEVPSADPMGATTQENGSGATAAEESEKQVGQKRPIAMTISLEGEEEEEMKR